MNYITELLMSLVFSTAENADYSDNAYAAINTLQSKWYDAKTGLWDNLWWQSGSMVETIAKFGMEDESFKQTAIAIVSNTYDKSRNQAGAADWKNNFYDDEGWWAMGWISAYDLTGDVKYLDTAKDIFEDMTTGWNTPCKGGIWWDKSRTSIAAISNELFLAVGASLANRVDAADKKHYLDWAQMEWDWFWNSGIINSDHLINDGIDNTTCKNDGKTTFTYTQGVILAGLSELARATSDGGYVGHAYHFASSSINKLSQGGILTEPVSGPLDIQSALFKGAFVRGLSALNANQPDGTFSAFLQRNADAAWNQDNRGGGLIPDRWQGGSTNVNTASHMAGIDALYAAATA
ncbi:hypothetical protein ACEQ8H_008023 [Pleosporales sp. CAS-2024a]